MVLGSVPVSCENSSAETNVAEGGRNTVAGLWGHTPLTSWKASFPTLVKFMLAGRDVLVVSHLLTFVRSNTVCFVVIISNIAFFFFVENRWLLQGANAGDDGMGRYCIDRWPSPTGVLLASGLDAEMHLHH